MNKSAIKNFAVNARKKLIEDVIQQAYNIGITEKNIQPSEMFSDGYKIDVNGEAVYITNTQNEQREKLIEQINQKGYEQVIEEVAYTWFNRIIAIRFMEVNDYLQSGIRILSSSDSTRIEPDAIRDIRNLIDEINLDTNTVYKYQDDNDSDGLFKYIFKAQCNELYKIMPVMFDKINDYTELLLPDRLLGENSVIRSLVTDIEEEDFKDQVEIIGWMYQYYISEKKDKVFADLKKNKKITKENIPAATQLFTPEWIVKYMVENSLGRLWLEGHPDEELKSNWKYYLEEAEQEPDVQAELDRIKEESKNLSPEDITVLDPSMGSGHILVYAFDVLYEIYLSAGYSEREIPRLILEKNIYGLDIDDRAGQLAYFALMMKARSKYRRFFRDVERNGIELNVCAIQESNGLSDEDIEYFANGDDKLREDMKYLVDVFIDAKEYGSILEVREVDFERIEERLNDIEGEIVLIDSFRKNKLIERIPTLIKQCKFIIKKYDVCITNPPYMGNRGMGVKLSSYLKSKYKVFASDLYVTFMEVCRRMSKKRGYISLVVMQSWMFLSTYAAFRELLLKNTTITSLAQIGYNSFPELNSQVAHAMTFTYRNAKIKNYQGLYLDLNTNQRITDDKGMVFVNRKETKKYYKNTCEEFLKIPNNTIAYNCNNNMKILLSSNKSISNHSDFTGSFHKTADNDKYTRYCWEVEYINIGQGKKWCIYSKGGNFRKYYGNLENIVDWSNEARNFYKENKTSNLLDRKYWYKEGITYNLITTLGSSFRYLPCGAIADMGGPTIYSVDDINYALGFLNSKVAYKFLTILNPTINVQVKDIKNIPYIYNTIYKDSIDNAVTENIDISRKDWNSFELSLDFKKNPIIEFKSNNIENSFNNWTEFTEKQFNQLKVNEEELNKIFIDIYGLQDELTPEVEDKDVTIRKADRDRDIKSFISYAVGCMLGRYSLDIEGLAFAGGEFDESKYKTFKVDSDGIIPITDKEYFEDDIVSKFVEFVKVVFGKDSLEENLEYIADTPVFKRKKGETARDTLRRYFLKGFIEDHIKIYQKRPIYWMFDSGKQNGFRALIYMHRYNEGTVAQLRTDYLHELQRKYEQELVTLDMTINSDVASSKEKTSAKKEKERVQKQIGECVEYDKVVAHVANQKISIDLDDGVKVNHAKFNESGAGKLLFNDKM